jgi:hypothetical protein
VGFFLGGFVAAEGTFTATSKPRPRLRSPRGVRPTRG